MINRDAEAFSFQSEGTDYDATYSDVVTFDFSSYVIVAEEKEAAGSPEQQTARSEVPN